MSAFRISEMEMASPSLWCIFCLRNNTKFHKNNDSKNCESEKNRKTLVQFLKVFSRYTRWTSRRDNNTDEVLKLSSENGGACNDCSIILLDFCDFYNQVKVLEMKLDWKLGSLKSVMKSADKVPSRLVNLRRILEEKDEFNEAIKFRKKFVKIAKKKLKSAVPRVKLKRCKSFSEVQKSGSTHLRSSCQLSLVAAAAANNAMESSFSDDEDIIEDIPPLPLVNEESAKLSNENLVGEATRMNTCLVSPGNIKDHEKRSEEATKMNTDSEHALTSEICVAKPSFADEGNGYFDVQNDLLKTAELNNALMDNNANPDALQASNNINFNAILNEAIEEGDHDDVNDAMSGMGLGETEYNGDFDESSSPGSLTVQPEPDQEMKMDISFSESVTEEATNCRRSKRRCVVESRKGEERHINIATVPDVKLEIQNSSRKPELDKSISSLKELALEHILKLRYICKVETCPSNVKSFFNPYDLIRHSALHGKFQCNFCDFKAVYAPALCHHEFKKHSPKQESKTKTQGKYVCPRCESDFDTLPGLKTHYLKFHLNLEPNQRTCGICQLPVTRKGPLGTLFSAKKHYLAFHALSVDDLDIIKRCEEPNCRAYFRTAEQRKRHNALVHNVAEKKKGSRPMEHVSKLKKASLSPYGLGKIKRLKRYPVRNCDRVSYTEEDFEGHSKLHGKFKCGSCAVVVNYARELFIHEKTHLEEDSPEMDSCPRCPFSVTRNNRTRYKLMSHFLETHLGLKMDFVTCPVCDEKFYRVDSERRKNPLRVHLRKCHDFSSTIYECEEHGCHAYFNSKLKLIVHRNKHKIITNSDDIHSDSKKRFQCKDCHKCFFRRETLLKHRINLHRKHLPHPCPSDACHERFETQEELERHISANETVMCPECGKSCHGRRGFAQHLKMSHGPPIKPKPRKLWVCEICGKSFRGEMDLRLHTFSHTGPDTWEFSCDTCGKKVLTQQKLEEHKRTHSKEKPFTCEHCGVSYAHRHNLRIHVNNKHSNVASDPARTYNTSRLISKKGVKLKKTSTPKPRRSRKRAISHSPDSSSSSSD